MFRHQTKDPAFELTAKIIYKNYLPSNANDLRRIFIRLRQPAPDYLFYLLTRERAKLLPEESAYPEEILTRKRDLFHVFLTVDFNQTIISSNLLYIHSNGCNILQAILHKSRDNEILNYYFESLNKAYDLHDVPPAEHPLAKAIHIIFLSKHDDDRKNILQLAVSTNNENILNQCFIALNRYVRKGVISKQEYIELILSLGSNHKGIFIEAVDLKGFEMMHIIAIQFRKILSAATAGRIKENVLRPSHNFLDLINGFSPRAFTEYLNLLSLMLKENFIDIKEVLHFILRTDAYQNNCLHYLARDHKLEMLKVLCDFLLGLEKHCNPQVILFDLTNAKNSQGYFPAADGSDGPVDRTINNLLADHRACKYIAPLLTQTHASLYSGNLHKRSNPSIDHDASRHAQYQRFDN